MTSAVEQNGTDERPQFIAPDIQDNPDGWGPVGVLEQFKKLPFQPFNKADKIGKVADWTGSLAYQDRRFQTRYTQQYSSGPVGTQYGYYHEEDDSSFQLVDTSRPQKTAMQRANKLKQIQFNRKLLAKERERRKEAGYFQSNSKQSRVLTKERQKQMKQMARRGFGQKRWTDQRGRWGDQKGQKSRQPSVAVRPDWEVLEDMDFVRLQKLRIGEIPQAEDIDEEQYGTLEFYEKSYDRVTTRSERPLQRIQRVYYTVTTTEDPVIQKLAKQNIGNVFATDILLSTLMCATRSVYSWDIVAIKIGDKIFLDKRDNSELDYITVSETASEPPPEDGSSLNLPKNLALEATFINRNFSQQILLKGEKNQYQMAHPKIPFAEDSQDPSELPSVAYRYRKWNLGPGSDGKDIILVCRTEHDGIAVGSSGKKEFLTIKAFNEWDSKFSGGVEWRSKLDSQRGAVVATELQNNSCKLAKWTLQALLAGSDQMKFGFVSRYHPRDSSRHVILCTCQYKPIEMATSISLNLENAWGIVRCIIDKCMSLANGKYLFMKDPNKPVVRMYSLPSGTFESSEDESDTETDDDDDDDEDNAVEDK